VAKKNYVHIEISKFPYLSANWTFFL